MYRLGQAQRQLYGNLDSSGSTYDPNSELGNDPFEATARLKTRYSEAGQQAPAPKSGGIGNLLMGALSVLDTPGNVIRGGLQEATEGFQQGGLLGGVGGLFKGAGSGLAGGLSAGKYGERYSTADWLKSAGVDNKYARGIGGFIGDVALDPLTYMSFGTTGVAKGLAKGAVKGAAARTVADTAGSIGQRLTSTLTTGYGKKLGKVVDTEGIARSLGGADDVLTESQRYLGTKGVTPRALDEAVEPFKQQAQGLYKNFTTQSEKARRRTTGLVNQALDPSIKGAVKGKSETGLELLNPVSKSSSEAAQNIRSRIETLFRPRELHRLQKYNPEVYDSMYRLGEVIGLGTMDIASMTGPLKQAFGRGFKRSAENLADIMSDTTRMRGVQDAGTRLIQSADEAARNLLEIQYVNGLRAVVDEVGKRRFVSFMGKPLADITPYTTDVVKKLGAGILKATDRPDAVGSLARAGVEIADAMTRTFSNKLAPSLRVGKHAKGRQRVIDRISEHIQGRGLVPRHSVDGVINALGREVLDFGEKAVEFRGKQVKPNDLFIYWKEGMEEVEKFERLVKAGVPEEQLDELISMDAITKYNEEIYPYLDTNSKTYNYFMRLNDRVDMMNAIYKSMDTALGKTYTAKSGYMHHAYMDESPEALEALIASGMSTLKTAGSSSHSPAMQRSFRTIAEAEKKGKDLKPLTNVIDIMAIRQAYSARLGFRTQFLEGTREMLGNMGVSSEMGDALAYQRNLAGRLGKEMETELADAEAQRAFQATVNSVTKGLGKGGIDELNDMVRSVKPRGDDAGRFVKIELGKGKEFFVDKQIAYQFQRLDNLFFNDQSFNQIKNAYDTVTRAIKTTQTVINPAFHLRNNAGEFVMTAVDIAPSKLKDIYTKAHKVIMSGGEKINISGEDYTLDTAIDLLKNVTNKNQNVIVDGGRATTAGALYDELVERTSIEIGGKKYPLAKLLDEFESNGLRDVGISADTFKDSITTTKQTALGQPLVRGMATEAALKGKNPVTKAARYAGAGYMGAARKASEFTDSYHRLAHYIGALERGEGFKQAANTVKLHHVDYQDLSRFEKNVMRRLAPYYTFTRKNLPMQLRLMLEKPAYPNVIGKIIDNSSHALGDPARPEYMEDNLAIPIFRGDDGNVISLNLSLPLSDVSKLTFDVKEGLRDMVGQMNPMLKAPAELATGQNIGLGIPIKSTSEYLASIMPPTRGAYKAVADIGEREEVEEVFGRAQLPSLARTLLPVTANNPMQTQLSEAYRYRDELMEDMKERKDKGEPIPSVKSDAEIIADMLGIPLRDVPKHISRDKYEDKASYKKYKRELTPRR